MSHELNLEELKELKEERPPYNARGKTHYSVPYNGGVEHVSFTDEDFMGGPIICMVLKCGLSVIFHIDGSFHIQDVGPQPISGIKYYPGRKQEDVDREDAESRLKN